MWLASKPLTSPPIRAASRDGSNDSIVRIPDRPSTSPAQVVATSLPSAVTMPIPVTTTRAGVVGQEPPVIVRAPEPPAPPSWPGSADELPRPDGRGSVDVAGQAAGRDRVRDGHRVEGDAADLGGDVVAVDDDEGPRRGRIAVEDVACRA